MGKKSQRAGVDRDKARGPKTKGPARSPKKKVRETGADGRGGGPKKKPAKKKAARRSSKTDYLSLGLAAAAGAAVAVVAVRAVQDSRVSGVGDLDAQTTNYMGSDDLPPEFAGSRYGSLNPVVRRSSWPF